MMHDVEQVEQRHSPAPCRAGGHTIDDHRKRDIIDGIEKRNQIWLLKHEANVPAAKVATACFARHQLMDRSSIEENQPAGRVSSQPTTMSSVVFPQPEGPTMATRVSGFRVSER